MHSNKDLDLVQINNWGSLNYFKLGGLKIPTKRLRFNPLVLMHGGINKPGAVSS